MSDYPWKRQGDTPKSVDGEDDDGEKGLASVCPCACVRRHPCLWVSGQPRAPCALDSALSQSINVTVNHAVTAAGR